MSIETHIAQFRLHFYRKDSIIKTKLDLNRYHRIYCPEDDKVYKHEFFFNNEEAPEPFLKEMGDYIEEDGDCEKDYFYFYTPKDVFYIEYLHEVGDFDYGDSNHITKWLDEMFVEDEVDECGSITKEIYNDVKGDINAYLDMRPNISTFTFERLINLQSHNYTTGYEYTEYECDINYMGIYKLTKPEPLSGEEMFKKQHGMSSKEFYSNINY